jgi:hypothetical protein
VISRYVFWAGSTVSPGATARLQVYRADGPATWRLVGQSTDRPYTAGTHVVTGANVPVQAGDVLALRLNHAGADTPMTHAATHALTTVGENALDPAVGDQVAVTEASSLKVNLAAWVESDADGDGYGDDSQDLCPADPSEHVDACTGSLIGDTLQSVTYSDTSCVTGPTCSVIQTGGNSSWTAPFDGVILRWRYKEGYSGKDYRLRVMRPTGNAGEFNIMSESDPLGFPGSGSIAHATTRMAVRTGDQIALSGEGPFWYADATAGTSRLVDPDSAVGATTGSADLIGNVSFLYNADVEPDADHDLWGDLTEDVCPTDAARRDDCAAPSITDFKLSNKRFVVNNKGAVVAKRRPKGTVFSLNMSEVGKVKFKIERATHGRLKNKQCRKAKSSARKKPKKCVLWGELHNFAVDANAGNLSVPYSGRYRAGKKVKRLAAGRYRVTAHAWDASNNTTVSSPIEFYVAASPKSRSSK